MLDGIRVKQQAYFLEHPGCTVFQRDKTQIKAETNGTKYEMALMSSRKHFF